MTSIVHPGRERLLTLVVPAPATLVDAQLRHHVDDCAQCQRELVELRRDVTALNRRSGVSVIDARGHHPSDGDLVDYVFGGAAMPRSQFVEAHLSECGVCMKEVLRIRAHRAARRAVGHGETGNQVPLTTDRVAAKPRITWVWQGLAAASVAAVTFAVILMQGAPGPDGSVVTVVPPLARVDVPSSTVPERQSTLGPESAKVLQGPAAPTPPSQLAQAPAAPEYPLQNDVLKVAQKDSGVNWPGGLIEATAIGTVDMTKMKNPVHAEITAENTARHLAYAKLAEILEGVRVTADSTYGEMLLRVSELKVHTDGLIRGAQVVNKTMEWVDGVPKATVTLRVSLFGRSGVSGLVEKYALPKAGSGTSPRATHRVLVDARDSGFAPALKVAMRGVDGETTVDARADPTPAAGAIRYAVSMEHALTELQKSGTPVVVRAAASGPGVLTIDHTAAALANVDSTEYTVVF